MTSDRPRFVTALAPIARDTDEQYIIKNIVIVSAAIVLGATVGGGELSPEPVVETRPT